MARPIKQIRWGMAHAATEFDINQRTLAKRLKTGDITPGEDGKYSTMQICAAVYGNIAGEKLRNEKLRADLLELELGEETGRLCDVNLAGDVLADVVVAITQKIKASHLSNLEKADILKDLRTINVSRFINKRQKPGRKA